MTTDLKTLHDQAVALERELGITDTPRLSTPILKERIATGEKINLQGRNGSNPPQWFPNPVGPGWTFLRIAEKPEAQRLVEEAFARGEKVKFQSRANPSENWIFLINGDSVRPLWDWSLFEYRIAAPEWKAGDALKAEDGDCVSFVGWREGRETFNGIRLNDPKLGAFDWYSKYYFTPYTPTPEERIRFDRIVKNAELKAQWEKERFPVQYQPLTCDRWYDDAEDCDWAYVHDLTYRRKPEPRFVPWSVEDAGVFAGEWVKEKCCSFRSAIIGFEESGVYLAHDRFETFGALLNDFAIDAPGEQLDGKPCGKEEAK